MKLKRKLDHIALLRALAIILVVFAHATRSVYSPNAHMYSPEVTPLWEIIIKHYIYSFHMPLFFWISGYIFYYSSIETVKFSGVRIQVLEKFNRLIVPMYSTSFLILLPTIIFFGHPNGSILHQVKLLILGSNHDHLWFLKTLFMIFFISIPLRNIINRGGTNIYIFVIMSWLILNYLHPPIVGSAIKYFPFFLVGFVSRKYEYVIYKVKSLYGFSIFFLLHFSILMITKFIDESMSKDTFFWYLTALFGIYFMFYLVKYLTTLLRETGYWMLIKKIDETSYSIYLFHVSFLYLVLYVVSILHIQIPLIRIFFSFGLGIVLPMVIHEVLSKSKIIAFLFGISKKNHSTNYKFGIKRIEAKQEN